jgi:outer membrane protein assembly factor BamB
VGRALWPVMVQIGGRARRSTPLCVLCVAVLGCSQRDFGEPFRAANSTAVGATANGQGVQASPTQPSGAQTDAAVRGDAEAPVHAPAASASAAGKGASSAGTMAPAAPDAAVAEQPPSDPGAPPEVARAANDWPLPNLDYQNTRNARTAIDSRNIGTLREAWQFQLSGGVTTFGYFTANTLIMGDVVYFQDMMSNVYALDRKRGTTRWTRMFDSETFGPNGVAIGWGKLFAAIGDSAIVALELDGGADVWKYSPPLGASMGIDIQPIVYAGQLYAATVPVSTSRGVYEGGTHGLLLAVDAETGAQRWSFDTVDSPDAWGNAEVNGGGGAWYPPLLDPARGLSYWGTGNPVPWPGTASDPSGASRPGPNLYTSSLVAVNISDGQLAWHYQDQPHDIFDWDFQITPVSARAAAQSGGDMVIGAGKTGALAALDAQTGELLWRSKVGRHENDELTDYPAQSITIYPGVLGGVMSALAYADGVVYAASVDASLSYDGNFLLPAVSGTGTLTAIDVRDGSVLWAAPLRGAGYGAATIANDLVLTADETGRVYAFARETGQEVWHYDAPAGINAPLVVAGDDLLIGVGMDRGIVIALSLHAPDMPNMGGAGAMAPPTAGAGGADAPAQPSRRGPACTRASSTAAATAARRATAGRWLVSCRCRRKPKRTARSSVCPRALRALAAAPRSCASHQATPRAACCYASSRMPRPCVAAACRRAARSRQRKSSSCVCGSRTARRTIETRARSATNAQTGPLTASLGQRHAAVVETLDAITEAVAGIVRHADAVATHDGRVRARSRALDQHLLTQRCTTAAATTFDACRAHRHVVGLPELQTRRHLGVGLVHMAARVLDQRAVGFRLRHATTGHAACARFAFGARTRLGARATCAAASFSPGRRAGCPRDTTRAGPCARGAPSRATGPAGATRAAARRPALCTAAACSLLIGAGVCGTCVGLVRACAAVFGAV